MIHLEPLRLSVSFLLGLGIRVRVVIDDDTITDFVASFGEIGLGPGGVGSVTKDHDMGKLVFLLLARCSS